MYSEVAKKCKTEVGSRCLVGVTYSGSVVCGGQHYKAPDRKKVSAITCGTGYAPYGSNTDCGYDHKRGKSRGSFFGRKHGKEVGTFGAGGRIPVDGCYRKNCHSGFGTGNAFNDGGL